MTPIFTRLISSAILLAALPFLHGIAGSAPAVADGTPFVESDPQALRLLPGTYPLERMRVDASKYPWSAIGLVSIVGGRRACTGVLISERHVLTAAHCVAPFRRFPREIHFLAGFQQDRYTAHSRAKKVTVSPGFHLEQPSLSVFSHDWALLELEQPAGRKAGYLGWARLTPALLQQLENAGKAFQVAGYRYDRRFVQTVDHRCQVSGLLYRGLLLRHQCPLTFGDSGGPVLISFGDQLLVAGIDVGINRIGSSTPRQGDMREGYAVTAASFEAALRRIGLTGHPLDQAGRFFGLEGHSP